MVGIWYNKAYSVLEDIMYIEVPGSKTHELPPLLLLPAADSHSDNRESALASVMPEAEDMLGGTDADPEIIERRKFDLALKLTEQYKGLVSHWSWGDSVMEWIRQCETTFEQQDALRMLLQPDVWPHASRASFVTLLCEKRVPTRGVSLERAVGLRLAFRQPPPIDCFSNQFLFYLNSAVADSVFQTWSHLRPQATALFPPERFHFEVLTLGD